MSRFFDFQEILGYHFDDESLLKWALTHSSVRGGKKGDDDEVIYGFDRLEFLGDRVLNLLVAELLFKKFKSESEGGLSHRYTALVCFEACAFVAEQLCIRDFLEVAPKTNLDDGHILCDAFEAILGAMYLDSGLLQCKKFVKKYWKKKIEEEIAPPTDPKSELQELVQSRWKTRPVYEVVEKTGEDHTPIYRVSVSIEGFGKIIGSGSSKKTAEKEAAQKLLGKIKILVK